MEPRKLLLGAASSLLLAGCGGAAPGTGPAPASTASASIEPAAARSGDPSSDPSTDAVAGAARSNGAGSTDASASEDGDPGTDVDDDPTADPTTNPDDRAGATMTEDGSGLEMPEAAEEPVEGLSELLGAQLSAPLVAFPLPRAASASARLVAGFPSVLRPTGSSVVETSSLSPSGDRLQVGLVATTSRSPDQVLVGYRRRLSAHGLVERHAPPAMPGSTAATFRRGRSSVTLTVMPEGSRTTYVVQGSLYAGRG